MDDAEGGRPAGMVIVTRASVDVDASSLANRERDTLCLTWEERRWTRRRVVTSAGREVALALPTGTVLRSGDVLHVEPAWYLAVEAAAEPVLAISPCDRDEAIRVAFEIGNRHFSLAIDGPVLLVPDDTAMEQLLGRLGVAWERRRAVFAPIGAGGHRHEPGVSAIDGHTHPDARHAVALQRGGGAAAPERP